MLTNLINVLRDDEGATLVEYGLLVSLIAVACMVIIGTLGQKIKTMFTGISATI